MATKKDLQNAKNTVSECLKRRDALQGEMDQLNKQQQELFDQASNSMIAGLQPGAAASPVNVTSLVELETRKQTAAMALAKLNIYLEDAQGLLTRLEQEEEQDRIRANEAEAWSQFAAIQDGLCALNHQAITLFDFLSSENGTLQHNVDANAGAGKMQFVLMELSRLLHQEFLQSESVKGYSRGNFSGSAAEFGRWLG